MKVKPKYYFILLVFLLLLFALLDLISGAVNVPVSQVIFPFSKDTTEMNRHILLAIRFPKLFTAVLAGASLSVCGVLMQTLFLNPLAGPYVLGINSGANLGAALIILQTGWMSEVIQEIGTKIGIAGAAICGALLMLILMLFLSRKFSSHSGLLLTGIILGQLVSAIQSLIEYFADAESIKSFVLWNLAGIGNTNFSDLSIIFPIVISCCITALILAKQLDVLNLGVNYASSLGVNLKRIRFLLIGLTGILSGLITAFCGPIAFIGLIIPHLCRLLFKTSRHLIILPASMLLGSTLLVFCDVICQLPENGIILPLNVITSFIGTPVILYLLFKNTSNRFA